MSFWAGRSVLVTGHTGFKGAWLTLWLSKLGARVTGLALEPDTNPNLFDGLGLARDIDHHIADIRDKDRIAAILQAAKPDAAFHLAAQSLVRRSYAEPVDTWATNVMGTIHVLEALRALDRPSAAIMVTTDKVYENRDWEFGYRESDALGGHDPYSASKAGAEIAIASWRRSFFGSGHPVRIASVRAGNVIGGGDWAEDRIVPDLVRSLAKGQAIQVRNPRATRPWQHVLEPLDGYMRLAERLLDEPARADLEDAFNFGPGVEAERTVRELVETSLRHWPGTWHDASDPNAPHEAKRLALAIDRARDRLGWTPRWDFEKTIAETIGWYRAARDATPASLRNLSLASIAAYEAEDRDTLPDRSRA